MDESSSRPPKTPYHDMSEEEVAAVLSVEEGREVSIYEIRRIETRALLKLRDRLAARGISFDSLTFSGDAGQSSLGFF